MTTHHLSTRRISPKLTLMLVADIRYYFDAHALTAYLSTLHQSKEKPEDGHLIRISENAFCGASPNKMCLT